MTLKQVNLSRLQSQLLTSGIQQTNNALYQVITQLLFALIQEQKNLIIVENERSGSGGTVVNQVSHTFSILDGYQGEDGLPGIPGVMGLTGPAGSGGSGGGGNTIILTDGNQDGLDGLPGNPGRSIILYEQSTEPLQALPGDLWITP
jgi:hypothetical protein